MKRPKYLDQEKFSYVQNYLEKSEAHSVTTEPSDSGLPRSHGTLSELGMQEISGKIKIIPLTCEGKFLSFPASSALPCSSWIACFLLSQAQAQDP